MVTAGRKPTEAQLKQLLRIFSDQLRQHPDDLLLRLKLAETLRLLGRHDEAVALYSNVAWSHAIAGNLVQAIMLCKLILELKPRHSETQQMLAKLYASKRIREEKQAIPVRKVGDRWVAEPTGRKRSKTFTGPPSPLASADIGDQNTAGRSADAVVLARPPEGVEHELAAQARVARAEALAERRHRRLDRDPSQSVSKQADAATSGQLPTGGTQPRSHARTSSRRTDDLPSPPPVDRHLPVTIIESLKDAAAGEGLAQEGGATDPPPDPPSSPPAPAAVKARRRITRNLGSGASGVWTSARSTGSQVPDGQGPDGSFSPGERHEAAVGRGRPLRETLAAVAVERSSSPGPSARTGLPPDAPSVDGGQQRDGEDLSTDVDEFNPLADLADVVSDDSAQSTDVDTPTLDERDEGEDQDQAASSAASSPDASQGDAPRRRTPTQLGPPVETNPRSLLDVITPRVPRQTKPMTGDLVSTMLRRDAEFAYRESKPTECYGAIQRAVIDAGNLQSELIDEDEEADTERSLHDTLKQMTPVDAAQASSAMPVMPLFSDLDQSAFVALVDRLEARVYKPRDVVIAEGDPGDSVMIVAGGRLEAYKVGEGGDEIQLAELRAGSFFGEFGLLTDRRRHASVRALADSEVLELHRDVLAELLEDHPSLGQTLLSFYEQRVLQMVLATSPVFQAIEPSQREQALAKFARRRYEPQQVIVREGEPNQSFYIILLGEVSVSCTDQKSGRGVDVGQLKEGDYFGEMSLVSGFAAEATVRSTRLTELLVLDGSEFYDLASQHPEVWEEVQRESRERAAHNDQLLAERRTRALLL